MDILIAILLDNKITDMIYKWRNISTKYAGYLGASKPDNRAVAWYDQVLGDPLPPLEGWEIPLLEQYLGEEGKERKPALITDCVKSAAVNLISQRAADALRDIWDAHALLYPVKLADKPDVPYYMVVPTIEIDCLDRKKSKGDIQKYGKDKGKGYFSILEEWVFREKEIGQNILFTLPDKKATIYVTEQFKQRVIEAGLTGFCFNKSFYDENPLIT